MNSEETKSLLDRVYIATPCNVGWENMTGDERARFCSACSKNVYNISDMTKMKAEAFLRQNGASVCLRFYRRADGTIMTDDCPVGLRRLRDRYRKLARLVSAGCSLLLVWSVLGDAPRILTVRILETPI